jgi:histidyl-tRNA synthetase
LKYASNAGIPFAVIIGQDEALKGEVRIKNMATGEQENVKIADLPEKLKG